MAPMLMTLAVMHTMALRAVEALRVVTLSELLSMAPRSAEASPLSPRAALLTVAPQVTMRDDVITALSSTLGDGRRVELEYPLMDFKELPVCVARGGARVILAPEHYNYYCYYYDYWRQ